MKFFKLTQFSTMEPSIMKLDMEMSIVTLVPSPQHFDHQNQLKQITQMCYGKSLSICLVNM